MGYLIVTYDDYFNIPYIQYYERALREQGVDYDIVLWNRSGQLVALDNAFVFSAPNRRSRLGKLLPFVRWRRFVLKLLKTGAYERLIILTTMPAVLLADQLLGPYRGRFWLDIRDYTYEGVPFYRDLVGRLVRAAEAVSVSSPAFREFLPEDAELYLTHNISNQDAAEDHCTLDPAVRPLDIGFVGGIQFVKQNRLLLRQFANDARYRLSYIGKAHPGCDLAPFCRENHIRNVRFRPAFTNDQKPVLYRDIQLINSVYGCDSPVTRLLLPNRLYDCVLFKKPILVSKGTYLAQVVARYHLGLAVDVEKDDVVGALEAYLQEFDREEFERGCDMFLDQVREDVARYTQALARFCGQGAPVRSRN